MAAIHALIEPFCHITACVLKGATVLCQSRICYNSWELCSSSELEGMQDIMYVDLRDLNV